MPWDMAGLCLVTQSCPTLCDLMDCSSPSSSVPGILQNTGVGCHALLQGIFPTQGLNLGLPHCWWILYHLSHQGSISTYIYRYLEYLVMAEYKEVLEKWTKGQKSQLRGSFTD